MAVSLDRLERNQILFREVNERIRTLLDESTGPTEFICECCSEDCIETLKLSLGEYERIRARPNIFFVAPGHEIPATERVVEETNAYKLVEKTNGAGYASQTSDVRARGKG
jgi:hypothetical protein